MKRRIVSLFLVVMLLLPAVSLAASTPLTITSDDIQGSVGDTVTVTINIAVEPPKLGQTMDSLQFVMEYDSAALEYLGIQEVNSDRITILGAQYMCNVTTKAGAVAFAASATTGGTGSGLLMHVKFKLLSAVSTMLVLKKVSYSFVTGSSGSQRGYTGGTINLGRITGQSVPTTLPPASYAPITTQEASLNPSMIPTDAPRFPVTEVTLEPGSSPSPETVEEDNDILAYIVFGLFIVVAIMICVVVTLMIVRRGKNKAQADFFADDEDEGYDESGYGEEEIDERAYRRGYAEGKEDRPRKKKLTYDEEEYERPRKKKQPTYDDEAYERPRKKKQVTYEEDEMPIQITRKSSSSGKKKTKKYDE